jgi:hypothetical protein
MFLIQDAKDSQNLGYTTIIKYINFILFFLMGAIEL